MSLYPRSPSSSSSDLQPIFNTALQEYERRTKTNLLTHPLAAQFKSCDNRGAIVTLLQNQVQNESQDMVGKLMDPFVNALNTLSVSLEEYLSLVISPAKIIFTGVGIFLLAAKETGASLEPLIDILERIRLFFGRLTANPEASLTKEMVNIVIRVMAEILSILAIATTKVKQGSRKKFMKKLLGRGDIEDGLMRLDTLTNVEVRTVSAQLLSAAHPADNRVRVMVDKGLDSKHNVVAVDRRGRVRSRESTIDDGFARAVVVIDGSEKRVAVQPIASDEPQTKLTQLQDDLRNWLSPADPATNHNIARMSRLDGTAEWFLDDNTYKQWKSTNSADSLLWIHGKPGSGKTVLCSAIVEDIEIMCKRQPWSASAIAYFYFDFRDINKQRRRDLVSSCLSQLSAQSIRYRDILYRLYLAHYSGHQAPSDGVLTECLKDMLIIPNNDLVFLFMDAIDECPNSSGVPSPCEQVLGLVEELVNLRLPNLRLCVTSRPEPHIRAVLEPLSSFWVSLHDKSGQKEDITNYIRTVVRSDRKMRRWREEDKDLVIRVFTEKADGSFRWVSCLLEVLRYCIPARVRHVLDEMPQALDETYERILMEINLTKRDPARRLFQCLAVASRPLRVEELAEVLAVDFDTKGATPKLNVKLRWKDPAEAVLSTCSSLVSIVGSTSSSVAQFSHFSVKEFLTSSRLAVSGGRVSFYHIKPKPAHTTLAQACLSVLLQLDDHFDRNIIGDFPLAEYAAKHWVDHARFENVTSGIQEAMEALFDPELPHFANWISIYDIDEALESPTLPHATRPNAAPLYYAALCGFYSLVEWLIDARLMDVDARGGRHETPIRAALYKGHLSIVRHLIDRGADMILRDVKGSSLLHVAAQTGDPEAVGLLLSRGADVQATDSSHWPVLFTALKEGNPAVVRLLIENGADTNVRDDDRSTALHIASGNEYSDVVVLLIECGADVGACDSKNSTPLHVASAKGNVTIARLLMDRGADLAALDNTNSTPLHLASTHGASDVVLLLIERGADVGACDSKNSTPLHLASTKGNLIVVRSLIDRGADVGARDEKGNAPLHLASHRGPIDVVELLLERGAEPSAQNDEGQTPLHIASQEGSVDIAQCLLARGANVKVRDHNDKTPLDVASNNLEVVQLLTEHALPNKPRDSRDWSYLLPEFKTEVTPSRGTPQALAASRPRGSRQAFPNPFQRRASQRAIPEPPPFPEPIRPRSPPQVFSHPLQLRASLQSFLESPLTERIRPRSPPQASLESPFPEPIRPRGASQPFLGSPFPEPTNTLMSSFC